MPKKREALSQARLPSAIDTWGEPGWASRLARSLTVGEDQITSYTHQFHTYPARLHPLTARRILAALELPAGAHLLDPFCGSGTVLVEAVLAGLRTSGLDASPLAVLVAAAKTRQLTAHGRKSLVARAQTIRDAVITEGKAARRSGHAPRAEKGVDARQAVLAGWFEPHVRRELEALLRAVGGDETLRAALSSIIIKFSRRLSDTRGDTTKRAIARGAPARFFAGRVEELVRGLEALWKQAPPGTPVPEIRLGDARAIPAADALFDAAVTSPPYAGTYDYAEQHALRMAFLGLPTESFAGAEIGARRSFRADAARARAHWEKDLGGAMAELGRVLRPSAPLVMIIGDSLAGTQAVYAERTVESLAAKAGFAVVAGASAARSTLGRVEREAFSAAPKREHVILLVRSASGRALPPRRSPSA